MPSVFLLLANGKLLGARNGGAELWHGQKKAESAEGMATITQFIRAHLKHSALKGHKNSQTTLNYSMGR